MEPPTYVGGSMSYDIAVLKVEASTVLMASNARAVDVADSNGVTILDTAIAIGNPGGGGLSATVGCINVDSENIAVKFETQSGSVSVSLRVMRTDAAVNSGNSGGGLFNDSGELIGIVNAKDADTTTDNIGYAIPSNVAKAIADNAIYYSDGTVKRCMLGITVGVKSYSTDYDTESGKIIKLEEILVTELTENAAVKGYLKAGDVINSITVDGVTHEVSRIFHVVDSMLAARVGSSVTVNITDADGTRDVLIPITENMLTVY
ncbi:MAG: trypsin-like serine protease [Ruminococcaceae bacterium]|nr:trypsin-like serine protease [Oscillospiraceae bacterium]